MAPVRLPATYFADRKGDNDNLTYQSLYKLDVPRHYTYGGTLTLDNAAQWLIGGRPVHAARRCTGVDVPGGTIIGVAPHWRLERKRDGPGVYIVPHRRMQLDGQPDRYYKTRLLASDERLDTLLPPPYAARPAFVVAAAA